ncbi:hypothetical protein [Pseudomonas coronafaciens]|uniref:hypothetical protein n=1 Tax=Pseudomonas coronafaciens TaxID=53409 RepID=UPI000EFFCEAD|nr:hypothetical protein [Pseudomonas coronafaciens]RMP31144.1 hypothetical protein ALQ25_200261 [Pseudomonas coronafaciens pv. atropurpurea]
MQIGEREAVILERGKLRLMASGDWLTRDDLYALMTHIADGPTLDIDGMLRDGMLFSIEWEGVHYFPRYAVSATDHSYVESLQMIIRILEPKKSAWGMAFWLGSTDSLLGGRQPKDVLAVDPEAVMEAARSEICGLMHG